MTQLRHKRLVPLAIVAFGVLAYVALRLTRPEPQRRPQAQLGTLVQVEVARLGTHGLRIHGQGEVIAARQVQLTPEVTGRIVWQSPELVPGGRVRAGEVLLRLDPRDYELALEQQKAAVDRAALELELERGRKKVAEREWQILTKDRQSAAASALALREPQLQTALMNLEAAQSAQRRAELNLERTSLRAPFNAMVQSEVAEVGQNATPQTALATLVGTDSAWVQVSVPVEHLQYVRVPDGAAGEGSSVVIRQDLGRQVIERRGRVIKLLADLDPVGRMGRVLVEVDDPLGLRASPPPAESGLSDLPLLFGAFVSVEIASGELSDVIAIPRTALRDGDRVYVATAESRLETRQVAVAWRLPDTVLVSKGLRDGERVITSRVPVALPNMLLRVEGSTPQGAAASSRP